MNPPSFVVDAGHPALAGHFPGHPLVPGVVILDEVIAAASSMQLGLSVIGLKEVKFHRPLHPGNRCVLHFSPPGNGHVRFQGRHGADLVAEGRLIVAEERTTE